MEARNQVFQRLKPICVALSQAALALNGPSANASLVAERLERLERELTSLVKPRQLDDKLADYVFFPLSQVLKASQNVSVRCLELAFQCLAILIDQGWRNHMQKQLAAQVLILCTLMAERQPKALPGALSTDELQASALWCLRHLFFAVKDVTEIKTQIVSEANIPQLGHTISTILDALVDSRSLECQVAAVNALQALLQVASSKDAQAAFLPGITSKLTKVLMLHTAQRRNHVVLVGALEVLSVLFYNTLSTAYLGDAEKTQDASKSVGGSQNIDDKWVHAASTQLKPAIDIILRLKDHSRIDVRDAVAQLCFVVLKDCRHILQNSASNALDTLLFLGSEDTGAAIKFRLEALVTSEPSILTLAQDTLYRWLQSLPIDMQSADDLFKTRRMHQIRVVYEIIASSNASMNEVEHAMAGLLRDSATILLTQPKSSDRENPIQTIQSLHTSVLSLSPGNMNFGTTLTNAKSGQVVIESMEHLIQAMQASPTSITFTTDLARSLRQTQGEMQLATFWLLYTRISTALRQQDDMSAFLMGDSPTDAYAEYLEDLYSFSLDILTERSSTVAEPRMRALALRTIALRARQSGTEFRFELVDALYPVLHTLATPDEKLQHDAMTALDIFTGACGYSSVNELIVENVDYLTNAVALKLNSFDVSPQAPQVLIMMVRLAGSKLLPYLEDTVESIFAALEDYHGYPLLVELLFHVLGVVAEEGTKADQLLIANNAEAEVRDLLKSWESCTGISDLANRLKERKSEAAESASTRDRNTAHHPQHPWKDVDETVQEDDDDGYDHNDDAVPGDEVELPPPAPKVYNLLLKMSDLTQHFLPSASPSLRSSLLALLKTTIPAMARHENSFLPLINTLWPEIVPRLDDVEPQIVANALDVISLLCEHAQDFMRSRIVQLWPHVLDMWKKTTNDIMQVNGPKVLPTQSNEQQESVIGARLKQAIIRMNSSPADYSDTGTRLLWRALSNATAAMVRFVGFPADAYDEALKVMEPMLHDNDVRSVFEHVNADAVWLVQVRSGTVAWPNPPIIPQAYPYSLVSVPS